MISDPVLVAEVLHNRDLDKIWAVYMSVSKVSTGADAETGGQRHHHAEIGSRTGVVLTCTACYADDEQHGKPRPAFGHDGRELATVQEGPCACLQSRQHQVPYEMAQQQP